MILTVTLNPAIDRTVHIEDFKEGKLNRVKSARIDPGGKGINVSKALSTYGVEQKATGMLAGMNGRHLLTLLDKYEFPKEFMMVSGETRVNIKINDLKTGLVTEINETGPEIQKDDAEEFMKLLKKQLQNCDIMILSGSLPKGLPSDFYARCIKMAADMNVLSILDSDGEALKLGCNALPFAIKPNLVEFERLTGKTLSDVKEIRDEMKALQETGIELILVSMGKDGSILSYRNKTYHAMPLHVKVKSTVASGDSMVAALAYCVKNDFPPEEIAKITSAAGSLTAALDGSDMSGWNDIKDVYREVNIQEI